MMQQPDAIKQFAGRRYVNLESYKRNGEPKQTPVQAIGRDGLVYFRTDPESWKVKRIRRNPRIRMVPSDRNGKPTGTWVEGEARLLEGEKKEAAVRLFEEEYGTVGNSLINLVARLRGGKLTAILSIELRPKEVQETEERTPEPKS